MKVSAKTLIFISAATVFLTQLPFTPVGAASPSTATINPDKPPQFIKSNFVELNKIFSITKFRSGIGHDFSADTGETCRSMKHYFTAMDPTQPDFKQQGVPLDKQPKPVEKKDVLIFSPSDGTLSISSGGNDWHQYEVLVTPTAYPTLQVRFMHVVPYPGTKNGMRVKAGQKIGLVLANSTFDVVIQTNFIKGAKNPVSYISAFAAMTPQVFQQYQKRGVTTPSQMILTKAWVDAHPWKCVPGNGQFGKDDGFAKNYADSPGGEAINFVFLSGSDQLAQNKFAPQNKDNGYDPSKSDPSKSENNSSNTDAGSKDVAWPSKNAIYITTVPLDLAQIQSMSAYRSCAGHNRDGYTFEKVLETNVSLKHYFYPIPEFQGTLDKVKVFAPFDGQISSIDLEANKIGGRPHNGNGLGLVSPIDKNAEFKFGHIYFVRDFKIGDGVKAGDLLGYAALGDPGDDFDIDLMGRTRAPDNQEILGSIIDHMSQSVLEEFAKVGVKQSSAIISASYRNSNACNFAQGLKRDSAPDWIQLSHQ